jgi:hypothetical protein
MNIEREIRELIESKREGVFWDFKVEPHENNAELLHDIICLANSPHKGNKYLIFGVSDPNSNCELKGLYKNHPKRKTQVQYIDFLRSKSFAGDNRPEIELKNLKINHYDVDVLIVFDRPLKPYYITQDFIDKKNNKEIKVLANNIYTRTLDTNTPINSSADISKIEVMWRERFGIDEPPYKRLLNLLLKPEEWFKDIGNCNYAYHKDFPEFRIEFSEPESFTEVYSYFFTNDKSYLGNAEFKYHTTTLFEGQYMFCDEMRIEFSVPDIEYIKIEDEENWYFYYDLSKPNGFFLYFLSDKLTNLNSRTSNFPFLIFKNNEEKEEFNRYLLFNPKLIQEMEVSFHGNYAEKRMTQSNKYSVIDPKFIDKVLQIKSKWASHNSVMAKMRD